MTSKGIPCPQSDCPGGTIDADGYCDTCGTLYVPPAAPGQASTPGQPSARGPNGCVDPACDGRITDDGYCDVCGTHVGSAAGGSPQPGAGNGTGGTGSATAGVGGGTGSGSGSASGSGSSRSGRSRRSTRTTGPRSRLGAGLVEVPELPAPDPTSMVLVDPQIPESRRICPNPDCRQPVGRGSAKRAARPKGFCGKCRTPFSFVPALSKGDRAGQYEIEGAIAHGGQGWIYLARDTGVDQTFWVVLKGMLDAGDADAYAAAVAERRFLASVDHSAIVKVYTFVEHAGHSYIVMEYVGGTSLRELLKRRRDAAGGNPDPLPVAEAISFILAVLPAFAYLHRSGLVFCDFKPDNVMLARDAVKLIDLGAVRRLDAVGGAIYGTPGYQGPEVARQGPSVASDLYTIGRTLAALILNFRGNTSTYRYRLPPTSEHPPLVRYDSLYRFLRKSTAPLPDDRFTSADEMYDELLGVLREIVAAEGGKPVPAPSRLFAGDSHLTGEDLDGTRAGPPWAVLPALRVDPADQAASTLAALPDSDPAALAQLLAAISPQTVEVRLRRARALMEAGEAAEAGQLLDEVADEDLWEWRVEYYRGLLALTGGDAAAARGAFDRVYSQAPGELAPKLALALAAEVDGALAHAERMYDIVSRTDDGFTSAAFGLARVRTARGDRTGAVAAYQRVPPSSAAHLDAQIRLARVLGTVTAAGTPGRDDIAEASRVLDRLGAGQGLRLDEVRRAALTRDLLAAAVGLVASGALADADDIQVAGARLRETDLRFALERVYREMAKQAPNAAIRYELVDLANSVRPRTLI
ncbi:serine/threonine-protein kinase [Pseudofrankia sp. BMG5.36]|uniref:serine/threonine-protein kinase n=1 Tax=Pseudofrankia sp. BMG5.36 TaxID=1834512 RepID=UPI0008DA51D8|nr:serine/threonine-protein kinase [Pseudofrankia sp. BMG5.36]OHV59278.1 serine/threonine protein kinase [Pseudofrankia sp. BMG5.36]